MSGAAIRVEGLGKVYRIGGPVERYKTLRDTVSQAVTGIGQRVRRLPARVYLEVDSGFMRGGG